MASETFTLKASRRGFFQLRVCPIHHGLKHMHLPRQVHLWHKSCRAFRTRRNLGELRKMQKITTLLAMLFVFTALDARADLITNGSFETTVPVVAVGTFNLYTPGSAGVTGWTVVGNAGTDIGVVNALNQSGIFFPAQSGSNWVDLTGLNTNTRRKELLRLLRQ